MSSFMGLTFGFLGRMVENTTVPITRKRKLNLFIHILQVHVHPIALGSPTICINYVMNMNFFTLKHWYMYKKLLCRNVECCRPTFLEFTNFPSGPIKYATCFTFHCSEAWCVTPTTFTTHPTMPLTRNLQNTICTWSKVHYVILVHHCHIPKKEWKHPKIKQSTQETAPTDST